jgi:hypothetical protein
MGCGAYFSGQWVHFSGNEKQWTSFFSLYRTYVSLYYNAYL